MYHRPLGTYVIDVPWSSHFYVSLIMLIMMAVAITPTTSASWISSSITPPSSSYDPSYDSHRWYHPHCNHGSFKPRPHTRSVGVPFLSLTASPHNNNDDDDKNNMEQQQQQQQPPPPQQSLETKKKNIQSGNVTVLDQGPHHIVLMKPPSVLCHHSEWAGARQRRSNRKQKNTSPNNDDDDDDDDAVEIPMLQRIREALQGERVNLIHRLDRGASGCLLCAYQKDKDLHTTSTLQTLMTREESSSSPHPTNDPTPNNKTYIALVRGEGILYGEDLKTKGWFGIDRPLKNENGVEKSAFTYFRFIAGQDNASGSQPDIPRASIVLARPITGRWHQIRKHLNGLSHPILGDSVHGNSKTNREWKRKWGLPRERTCLHLARIQLSSPSSSSSSSSSLVVENEKNNAPQANNDSSSSSSSSSSLRQPPTVEQDDDLFPNGIDVSCPLADDMLSILENHLPELLKEAEPLLEEEGIFIRSKDHCQVLPYEIEIPPL